MLQTVNAQVHTTIKNMNVEGNSNFSEMTERSTAIEASPAVLEDTDTRTHAKKQNIDELHQRQEDQKKARAATGFHEDTTEQEARELLTAAILKAGMSTEGVQIKCPAKPTTHAFLQFTDVDERDKYIRSAYRQRSKARGRNIRFSQPWMRKRYQQKRLGYIRLSLSETHKIPLEKIILNRATKHVSIHGRLVINICANGSLKCSKYQDVELNVEEHMGKWLTKARRIDCEQSKNETSKPNFEQDHEWS